MDDAKTVEFENKLNNRHRQALAAARKVMRTSRDRQLAAKLLNDAFKENCKIFLEATK